MAIKILTDSSSDLSPEMIGNLNIEVIPMLVYVDDVEFEDEITITSSEIAQAMLDGKNVHTAQTPLYEYQERFEKLDPEDTLLCIPISSGISGSYQVAVQAANLVKEERPELDIRVLDAKTISLALGIVLLQAGQMIEDGKSADEIENFIIEEGKYMRHVFTVPNLTWLLKGGRVSKTSAKMGTLLDIKPILHVEDGKLVVFDKVRGQKHRLNKMKEYIKNNADDLKVKNVGITHVENEEEAQKLADFLKENFEPKEVIVKNIGAVITSHCGPGLLCVFFRSNKKEDR